jgi:hypothetical protein
MSLPPPTDLQEQGLGVERGEEVLRGKVHGPEWREREVVEIVPCAQGGGAVGPDLRLHVGDTRRGCIYCMTPCL